MAVSSRLIRRRIKSIANTRKITKAMELVAASKMRRAVGMALASRTYSNEVRALVDRLRPTVDQHAHPLLGGRIESQAALVMVASSDRGLCGGFNVQLLKKSLEFLSSRHEKDLRVVTVGKRAEAAVRRAGYPITASFEAISNAPSAERAAPIGTFVFREFMEGRADRVFIAFTDFRSAISQVPTVVQLLPIIPESMLLPMVELDEDALPEGHTALHNAFEPDPETVLNALFPRLIETRIYQSLLESAASEHSSRMMAMRNATENASEMLQDLTLTFNQARQAMITREISEISAGKAAIE